MTQIGGRDVGMNDLGIMAAGGAALIFSVFPYYGYSVSLFGVHSSSSINAWHSFSFLGLLLVLAVAVIVALRVFGVFNLPKMPVGPSLALLVGAGLGTLLIILRAFTYNTYNAPGATVGPKFGAYLLMLACLAQTAFAFLAFRASGETLPDLSAMKSSGAGTATPPPAQPYAPPAPPAPPTYSPPPPPPPSDGTPPATF